MNEEEMMEIQQYLFQSPYSSQVQIGRPDPSAAQNEQTQDQTNALVKSSDQTRQEAQNFQSSQTKEVEPQVSSSKLLDTYA